MPYAPPRPPAPHPLRLASRRLRAALRPLDPALYALWAAVVTLASARAFYGYMLKQTGGEWSAPLDDVFIHFDYARSIAVGHPFEWVAGNGYSSGNTSILYPFVLALGYLGGYRGQELMVWAGVVAAMSVFGTMLAVRGLFLRAWSDAADDRVGRGASYLVPPALMAVGALAWSLWSGMEVAFFLGMWACALQGYLDVTGAGGGARPVRAYLWLGAWGVVLVLTRPEAVTTLAVFGLFAAAPALARRAYREAAGALVAIGAPGALALAAQAVANRVFTGEWSANGAIVKLAINSPFLSAQEKLDDYVFNLKYTVFRNTEYHFTDAPAYGVVAVGFALLALALPRTRAVASLLWAQIGGWLLVIALNGQVRWQNERYTMPAVAWLLVAAALGVAGLVAPVLAGSRSRKDRPSPVLAAASFAIVASLVAVALRRGGTDAALPALPLVALIVLGVAVAGALVVAVRPLRVVRVVGVAFALGLFVAHQSPRMRDQKWFFGRASRNIRDQHLVAGRYLREIGARRVLVGDAGALLYASDLPGLDIIGLGGFHDLPFARAGVHGLAASIELVERMRPADRPDVFAIYPTWWGVLPLWFTSEVLARFPVEGNVICGGYEKVVYRADWHALDHGAAPWLLPVRGDGAPETVRDELDAADLVSERLHGYRFAPGGGWTDMKILTSPGERGAGAGRDVFDGGRREGPGLAERFVFHGLTPGAPGHLVVRTAAEGASRVRVRVAPASAGSGGGGATIEVGTLDWAPSDGWSEAAIAVPASAVTSDVAFELANDGPADFVDYHAWFTQ